MLNYSWQQIQNKIRTWRDGGVKTWRQLFTSEVKPVIKVYSKPKYINELTEKEKNIIFLCSKDKYTSIIQDYSLKIFSLISKDKYISNIDNSKDKYLITLELTE